MKKVYSIISIFSYISTGFYLSVGIYKFGFIIIFSWFFIYDSRVLSPTNILIYICIVYIIIFMSTKSPSLHSVVSVVVFLASNWPLRNHTMFYFCMVFNFYISSFYYFKNIFCEVRVD